VAHEFETWVDEHGDALLSYALPRVRDRHAAEDLVQETFLAALRAQDTFRGESTRRTWLVGILRHKLLDHLRRQSRERPTEALEPDDPAVDGRFDAKGWWRQPPGGWTVDPAAVAEDQDFWRVFEECLAGLSEKLGRAFGLRVMAEIESEEVCKVLGITSTNLWVMLHRARARLRSCLEANWFGRAQEEPD
jgi:RNA polymerase sigma-70 factor (TIGR02943 family)